MTRTEANAATDRELPTTRPAERGHHTSASQGPDISVLMLTRNERQNLESIVKRVSAVLTTLSLRSEVVVVDSSRDGTIDIARQLGCRVVAQTGNGYGAAFREGLAECRGEYILTLDADHSHDPEFLYHMWALRDSAEIVIGSRYVPIGRAEMGWTRRVLSRLLNVLFGLVLRLPYHDLSSGYRLYRRRVIESTAPLAGQAFDVLQEILVKAHCQGWRIREVPLHYRPRHRGRSNASALRFAWSYLRTLGGLWRLRNGIGCCDYDARAYHSWIVPQRYWQRRRFAIIESMLRKHRAILDIGCGSSEIIRSLPAMVGLDVNIGKLRFLRSTNPRLVRGSAFALPFRSGSFSTVVCSEVIEHIPMSDSLFEEMTRVLEPGGTLVLGTPDYDSRLWVWIEYLYKRLMPGGYADEHISHYTSAGLVDLLRRFGFEVVSRQSILGAEVIFEGRKLMDPVREAGNASVGAPARTIRGTHERPGNWF